MGKDTSNRPFEGQENLSDLQNPYTLVLFNDEVNLYEYVINSLVDVCNHSWEQAEQCTLIAHHKGKCEVKNGSVSQLRPLHEELTRRGLSLVILEN